MLENQNIPMAEGWSGTILSDKDAKGRERPWRPKRVRSALLAESYKRLGEDKKSERVRDCGTILEFAIPADGGNALLHRSNFCRDRMCPLCTWRRSLRVFHELSRVMDDALQDEKLVPIFLTLTVRNCSADELAGVLDSIFEGWNRLNSRTRMRRIIKGWFRSLEVTYSKKTGTFHPHVHAILLVDKGYFKGKDFIKTEEWVKMWQDSLNLDYAPVCDVRKVKNGKGKSILEVSKYAVKDTDYISASSEQTDYLVSVFSQALKNRRLYAYGGILKDIAKRLGAENAEDGDLVHVDGESIRPDVAYVLVRYRWRMGQYIAD